MKVSDLLPLLNAKAVCIPDGEREVTGGYCGDFLSFVMGRAPAGCCWFTVMTNVNVAAVASLADVAAVAVCENCACDAALVSRCEAQGINLLSVSEDVFGAVRRFLGK